MLARRGSEGDVRKSAGARRRSFGLLGVLYFASGAVGLLDEVIFSKYLACVFGSTANASSAVLVAFMGGLALGAAAATRLDRRVTRPLLAYGVLEMIVGAACAASPWLFATMAHLYPSIVAGWSSMALIELVRGALTGVVVLLPTAAMGATLPFVARIAGGPARDGARRLALLYGANTAGGAAGSVLGAYIVIPSLGLAASLRAGACVSVAIGIAALVMSRDGAITAIAERRASSSIGPARERLPVRWAIAAAASGTLVFASEVVFVHVLALVDGTSVYVFGLVLAVFLLSLSAGAAASRWLVRRTGEGALSASLAISGLALAATVPLWDRLPQLFVAAGPHVTSWSGREAMRGIVAALAMGLPATCMGTTFPILLGRVAGRDDRGAQTGRLTALNTVASIVGSLAAGFVLLPLLGSQRSCWAIALAYALVAVAVRLPAQRWTWAPAAMVVVLVAVAPRWDLARLASGANIYFERQPEEGSVVWSNEDVHGGVVTVTRTKRTMPSQTPAEAEIVTLWTNGKYQGDDGFQVAAQRAFADIPAMFVHHFDRALVIGLGTGTTLGALAQYPFEHIDLAELSPGIITAAHMFFGRVNGGVLDDPRVRVVLGDGRNLLLVEPRLYDLVTIELTSIWFSGAANLYSREFYATAAARLNAGGVLSQWIQLHHTTLLEIASQMVTARAVFPHAAFFVRGDQGLLVVSEALLEANPRTTSDLEDLVLADDTLDAFIDGICSQRRTTREALLSTDDDRLLEYATPRNNVPGMATIAETAAAIRAWRRAEVATRVQSRLDDKCSAASDCGDLSLQCINGYCATIQR